MDNQLLTLSKIFTERLFRIPDYQRGYAWGEKQLKDFWNDIQQLEQGHNHYTGVLTLESVPHEVFRKWDDDLWIIDAKSYQPYFVVDGQQRLTTAIILIQTILEKIDSGEKLNFTERSDIQRRFIFDSKDDGISRSYLFGYEKDNPSYEYLKTKIFGEISSSDSSEETAYTQNLARAKEFFAERLSELPHQGLESLYKKITQHLLFNIFTISEDVDVCVAFETMNNRGKPLSYLELLKNRLIYLSLKFDADEYERRKLRATINDCWKAIYHNLGRNKSQPLDDDLFLQTHFVTYFGKNIFDHIPDGKEERYERLYRINYSNYLLGDRFVSRNVVADAPAEKRITVSDVYSYVSSLQEAVKTWYKMWNPLDSDFSPEIQLWLDKINRINIPTFRPLILAFLQSEQSEFSRLAFLKAIERHLFILSLMNSRYNFQFDFEISPQSAELAIELTSGKLTPENVIKSISENTSDLTKNHEFIQQIVNRFRSSGFYYWNGIRYFLFEYNLSLQEKSKTERPKIFWPEFSETKSDYISVEHIYPRQARNEYWTSRFKGLSQKQKEALRDSLGNLLPLSKPKNSSLSNNPFPDKVDGPKGSSIGYRYGCYAENEVTKEKEWTPNSILLRGLKLIHFLERRWNIEIGDEKQKKVMLGLDFMK
ncbi:DUF262 domain-containing protein [Methylomonas sp. DH-1]|uniref:DUF262 domain-containing protein n=1 Tax=Methylomonas sp. (strain DH-1) TaxID=1727196 RepID=UPI0007C8E437|nr:DUF262 domain-containing protein [Methylomonas sp. DH-1]